MISTNYWRQEPQTVAMSRLSSRRRLHRQMKLHLLSAGQKPDSRNRSSPVSHHLQHLVDTEIVLPSTLTPSPYWLRSGYFELEYYKITFQDCVQLLGHPILTTEVGGPWFTFKYQGLWTLPSGSIFLSCSSNEPIIQNSNWKWGR